MVDAGIGRLLIASLHQGIADVSPTRLDFYENWLSPTGLRDGRMGLAPLGAVLSFLQREEPPADRAIPVHAGACAAAWTYDGLSPFRKSIIKRLPLGLRARAALGVGRALVAETTSGSKIAVRLQQGRGTIAIRSPLFEYLRDPSSTPMRLYYASAYTECLKLCEVDGLVEVDASAAGCRLNVTVRGPAAITREPVREA
jgi:hypothetical protein